VTPRSEAEPQPSTSASYQSIDTEPSPSSVFDWIDEHAPSKHPGIIPVPEIPVPFHKRLKKRAYILTSQEDINKRKSK